MDKVTNDPTIKSWRRYFRRSNVHIAEYILMLVLMGALAGLVSSMIYTFFNFLKADGSTLRTLHALAAGQLGALVVVVPAAFWFYARVSGQEMVQPELRQKTARTVFLTIWLIGMFLSIVGVSISVVSGVMATIVGAGSSDAGSLFVNLVVPGIFTIVLLAMTVIVVAHRSSRKLSMAVGIAVAVISAVVFIGTITVAVVKSDNSPKDKTTDCTYSRYRDGNCNYRQYRDDLTNRYDNDSAVGGFENIYQPSSRYR